MKKRLNFTNFILVIGLLFIYLPMLILVVYSFNASKMVVVWEGWSTKWYRSLLESTDLIAALFRSLEVAFYTALTAVVIGTLAAFVLTRMDHFRGRSFFAGMVTAPLVMPEIITGFSLLLLFIAFNGMFGWPSKGLLNIWIAHVTFCTAYVAILVSSRLRELDRSIDEASMDLGAPPWKTFIFITIPMILPSLFAGAMLSFALSLDDVVLANFLSGPGSTTLPVYIFSKVRLGVDPQINAIASIILLIISTITLIVWFVNRRFDKKRRLN